MASNTAALDAANKAKANADAQVKTAVTDLDAKEATEKTVDADKASTAAEKDAAKYGVTEATTHHANTLAAQKVADDAVTKWTDAIKLNNDKITWGKAWIKDNTDKHQVTWMNNRIAGQNDLASAKAVQAANVAAEAKATGAAKTLLTAQVAGGKAELANADNLVKWNTYTVDHSDLAAATKIQKADAAACAKVAKADQAANVSCRNAVANDASVKALTAAADAASAKDAKADAAVKAADKNNGGKNEDDARAELARLHQAAQDAAWAKSQCKSDCAQVDAADVAAKAAVTKQTAYLKDASNFTHSSDAATAIIIICVSAFVCITGGCLWTHHEKKKAAAKEAEHAKVEAGEAVPTMEADAAVNFNDDAYTAMVDCEM